MVDRGGWTHVRSTHDSARIAALDPDVFNEAAWLHPASRSNSRTAPFGLFVSTLQSSDLDRAPAEGREPYQNMGAGWGGSTPRRSSLVRLSARSAWRGSGRITTGQEAW
jgi:hypothetical protein